MKNGLVTVTRSRRTTRVPVLICRIMSRAAVRGASYSRYLYSANRVKYPMVRKRPESKLWREAKAQHADRSMHGRPLLMMRDESQSYKQARGRGGFVRSDWQEVNEMIAAANVVTAKQFRP